MKKTLEEHEAECEFCKEYKKKYPIKKVEYILNAKLHKMEEGKIEMLKK